MVRRLEREVAGDPALEADINLYNLPELWLRERQHCPLCDVAVGTSVTLAKLHFNSRQHRLAAGLHLLSVHREEAAEAGDSDGPHCGTCNYRAASEAGLLSHQAGIRHRENEQCRLAVEAGGGEWKPHCPAPPPPPRYSVQWLPPAPWQRPPPWLGGGPPPPPWQRPEAAWCSPLPIPWDPAESQTQDHPLHCAVCNTWLPTVTILKHYHR